LESPVICGEEGWVLSYWLELATQEHVYQWLQENKPEREVKFLERDTTEIEKALLIRNEPLINLGLALYGQCSDTGRKLLGNNNKTIDKAVLSGTTVRPSFVGSSESWVEQDGVVAGLLTNDSRELLATLVQNPNLPDDLLLSLLKKNGVFKEIEEELWLYLIGSIAGNPRLGQPYPQEVIEFEDGFVAHQYSKVVIAAWALFATLAVTKDNAIRLGYLGKALYSELLVGDFDVMAAIKRWHSEEFDDYCELVRNWLCKLLTPSNLTDEQFSNLAKSDNERFRRAYYRHCMVNVERLDNIIESDEDMLILALTDNKPFLDGRFRPEVNSRIVKLACEADRDIRQSFIQKVEVARKQKAWLFTMDRDYLWLVTVIEPGIIDTNSLLRLTSIQQQVLTSGTEESSLTLADIQKYFHRLSTHLEQQIGINQVLLTVVIMGLLAIFFLK